MSRELRQAAIDAALECVAAIDGDRSRAQAALESIRRLRDAIALDAEIDGQWSAMQVELAQLRKTLATRDSQLDEVLKWQRRTRIQRDALREKLRGVA